MADNILEDQAKQVRKSKLPTISINHAVVKFDWVMEYIIIHIQGYYT